MGIPGLTTFINRNSHRCMENFQLHNTNLVIDGNSLASQLYVRCSGYCTFGGDYDKFRESVKKFFDELDQCQITPYVLIDGGTEEKKVSTMKRRINERIRMVANWNLTSENHYSKVFPTLIKESFKEILRQRNIKFATTTFEADSDIAALAKFLRCPVLSFDSDFYIYDVDYIPFFTLDLGVSPRPDGKGYMKNCEVYRVERLLQGFHGLKKSVLPLLAALLGNDYVSSSVFSKFLQSLKLSKMNNKKLNDQQRRIQAVFCFLKDHSLESGIDAVLDRLPSKDRAKVLKSIELVINAYVVLSSSILLVFNFSEHVEEFEKQFQTSQYFYTGRHSAEEKSKDDYRRGFSSWNQETIKDILPGWFLKEFNQGHFPAFFIDFVTRQVNIMSIQVEEMKQPSTVLVALPILRVMYKLVTTGVLVPYKPLTYLVRNVNQGYDQIVLECPETILGNDFPPLHKLRDVPENILKQILDDTMGLVPEMRIKEVPDSWQLYIGTIIFWLKETVEPPATMIHLQSIVFAMLFHIVDDQIGFYRRQNSFINTFKIKINEIETKRKNGIRSLPKNVSFDQAIEEVTVDDCLMAGLFFVSNFDVNLGLKKNPRKFNVKIVHVFNMLQSCMKHSLYLNALLGYPYRALDLNKFFNGTFLYNLYVNFKGRNNVDEYVKHVLQYSPSLLRVYEMTMEKVQLMCNVGGVSIQFEKGKRRKRKNKCAQITVDSNEDIASEDSDGCEFYGDNKFVALVRV